MVSQKVKGRLKQAGTALFLLTSVSAYAFMSKYVTQKTKDFDKKDIVIENDTLTLQKFYENMSYKDRAWYLELKDGRVVNVDSVSDFCLRDSAQYHYDTNVQITRQVDTVDVRFAEGTTENGYKYLVYSMGNKDDLGYVPSMGNYNHGVLKLRYFRAKSEYLQSVIDRLYNDTINRTSDHEMHHYHNVIVGIRLSGQSYEVKFCECGFDEISANIVQLLAQRKNYLEHNCDENLLTKRFSFYKEAIKSGQIKPEKNKALSQEEIDFIANGVFDTWMKDKYPLYIDRNVNRTINILKNVNYNGIQPNNERHINLMKKMFTIDGMDFYSAISKREDEMKEAIPEHVKKRFLGLKQIKYKEMKELDKLEQMRIEKGKEEYDKVMFQNKIYAKLRKYCVE